MLDLLHTVTTFTDHSSSPSPHGVQFSPIIDRHVTHVSPERIKVTVRHWVRGGETKTQTVSLDVANTLAAAYRCSGYTEEKWG